MFNLLKRLKLVLKDVLFSLVYFHMQKLLFALERRKQRKTPSCINTQFGVNYAGYLGSEKGLGEAARAIIRIIQEIRIPFALNNIEHRWQKDVESTFANLYVRDNPYAVNILHVNADMVPYVANILGVDWFKGRYNIGYWFWELENFPPKWKTSFQCFDEIWVASRFCKDAISKISPVPVRIVHPAVRLRKGDKYDRQFFGLREGSFVFLFIFDVRSQFERKNPLGVIAAFKKAFKGHAGSEVTLVLKFTRSAQNEGAYREILRASEDLPILVLDSHMEREMIHGLMSSCDCYVSLHRSEGFGLTIAEAMYLGKPSIATAYSGNMEFMNNENSLLVDYAMKKIDKSAGPYEKGNYWADPDIDHAADMMRLVYEDRARAEDVGAKASSYMENNFSAVSLGRCLESVLREIFAKHCA